MMTRKSLRRRSLSNRQLDCHLSPFHSAGRLTRVYLGMGPPAVLLLAVSWTQQVCSSISHIQSLYGDVTKVVIELNIGVSISVILYRTQAELKGPVRGVNP